MSNMKFKGLLAGAAVGATIACSGGSAWADTVTYVSDTTALCAVTDVSGTGAGSAADCFGAYFGPGNTSNPSNIGADAFETAHFTGYATDGTLTTVGLFGKTDWNLVAKTEGTGTASEGDGNLTYDPPLSSSTSPNDWDLLNDALDGYAYSAVMLKQSNGFAAYLFNSTPSSGTWFSSWWDNNPGDLSNMTVWGGGECTDPFGCGPGGVDDPISAVPLPAGLPLILAGLGVFGALRLRKRKAA